MLILDGHRVGPQATSMAVDVRDAHPTNGGLHRTGEAMSQPNAAAGLSDPKKCDT